MEREVRSSVGEIGAEMFQVGHVHILPCQRNGRADRGGVRRRFVDLHQQSEAETGDQEGVDDVIQDEGQRGGQIHFGPSHRT